MYIAVKLVSPSEENVRGEAGQCINVEENR